MKRLILILSLLVVVSVTSTAQNYGFFFYDQNGNKALRVENGDTVNLTDVYLNRWNFGYEMPQEPVSYPVYSFSYDQFQSWNSQDTITSLISDGGVKYWYSPPERLLYLDEDFLPDSEEAYDSLFEHSGPLEEGAYTFKASAGPNLSNTVRIYGSVTFLLLWRGGQSTQYYLIDPISQTPLYQIQPGDTLSKSIGNTGALIRAMQAAPGQIDAFDLYGYIPDIEPDIDNLSYFNSQILTYNKSTTFMVPGYAGSGRYWLRNRYALLDTGFWVYVPNPKGVYVDQYTKVFVDTIIADTTIYRYNYRDSTVYQFFTKDSIEYNIVEKDSIMYVYSDSLIYDTARVSPYDELILPYVENELQSLENTSAGLRELMRRIREQGLKEDYSDLKND